MKLFVVLCVIAAVLTATFVFAQMTGRGLSETQVIEACQKEIKARTPQGFITFPALPGTEDYLAPGHLENARLWLSTFVAQDVYGTSVEREFSCEVSKNGAVEVYLFSN